VIFSYPRHWDPRRKIAIRFGTEIQNEVAKNILGTLLPVPSPGCDRKDMPCKSLEITVYLLAFSVLFLFVLARQPVALRTRLAWGGRLSSPSCRLHKNPEGVIVLMPAHPACTGEMAVK